MALQAMEGQGLSTDCCPDVHLSAHKRVGVNFLQQDYYYKSIATKIHNDAGLEPVHPAGNQVLDGCVRVCDYLSAMAAVFYMVYKLEMEALQ